MNDSTIDAGTAFLMEAFDPVTRANPYGLYQRMRETSPVLDAGNNLWFTFSHSAAMTLLRAKNVSSDERRSNEYQRELPTSERHQEIFDREPLMLFTDPPDHTRLRSLVSRAFTARRVEQMMPAMQKFTDDRLDEMAGAGPIDLVEHLAYALPLATICNLLGVPEADARTFRDLSDDLTLMIEPGQLRTEEQEAAIDAARAELETYIGTLLSERRQRPGDDLISGLLAARDGDDRLSEPELINMVLLLLLAGHETTVNLIGNGAVALLRHPDQLAAWQQDSELDKNAVDELVRYDSPVQIGMRVLTEPTELHGQVIPAFDQVTCLLGAANRDPDVFGQPDQLDLARPNAFHNMSFGGGIHHCLGMALARMEGQIALGSLVRRFSNIALVTEPEVRARFVLRGYEQVMVEVS